MAYTENELTIKEGKLGKLTSKYRLDFFTAYILVEREVINGTGKYYHLHDGGKQGF